MRRKGFTLVELLVVIAIIALLMGILMPALSRVRQLAFRLTCGTNLSGIGKAMLIYANDYEDELPRAGGRSSLWAAQIPSWVGGNNQTGGTRQAAFGLANDGSGGKASITSCFYLLVKYAEVTPKSFICKGDAGASEFKLTDLPSGTVGPTFELINAWDFGPNLSATDNPSSHCSYTYHMPFQQTATSVSYALTTSSEPGFAVAGDRNPWIASPGSTAQPWAKFKPDLPGVTGTSTETGRAGNSIVHQNDGQNVLFLDSHVEFAKRSFCSLEDDNIYTSSTKGQQQLGDPLGNAPTGAGAFYPTCRKDSVLVHDDPSTAPPKRPGGCFAGETPTWVDGRLLRIDQVVAGQAVAVPHAKQVAFRCDIRRIEKVDAHAGAFDGAHTVVLENGESFCVVGSHVFLLDCGTWVPVEALRAGSVLRTHSGPMPVRAAICHDLPYVGTVYNLKVTDSYHYFVGRAGVVVRDY